MKLDKKELMEVIAAAFDQNDIRARVFALNGKKTIEPITTKGLRVNVVEGLKIEFDELVFEYKDLYTQTHAKRLALCDLLIRHLKEKLGKEII